MSVPLLPRSLANRTILILLTGFAVVQILGLLIQTLNQVKLEQLEEDQEFATRATVIYRHIALAAPEDRVCATFGEQLRNAVGGTRGHPGGDILLRHSGKYQTAWIGVARYWPATALHYQLWLAR